MSNISKGKVYGAVTVGERGQVVIPAEIRRSFKIKPGDKLIVFARPDNVGFIPAKGLNNIINEAIR